MATDRTGDGLGAPAVDGFSITPHDSNELTTPTRGIYVGVTGDLKVRLFPSGTTLTFVAAPVGYHPIRADLVYSTGTTATSILGLF